MRQELALYNPGYCARPHAVALNKMDLEDASALAEEVQQDILDARTAHAGAVPPPWLLSCGTTHAQEQEARCSRTSWTLPGACRCVSPLHGCL